MTKKITLLFPGQGSQYVGMGEDLVKNNKEAQELLSSASDLLRVDLKKIMLEGPQDELQQTRNTQPALLAHSYLLYLKLQKELEKMDIQVHRVLGHSIGEYSALLAAESLDFLEAVCAVQKRGEYMQEAVPAGVGAMYALVKVPSEIITKACDFATENEDNAVMPANYNGPQQVVISGHTEACEKAVNWIKENYPEKHMAIPLKVSAPFHSTLMKPAEINLANYLKKIKIKSNKIAYMANYDASEYPAGSSAQQIYQNLVRQVCGSVLWGQSMTKLSADEYYIEVGPGKVLTGINKKINPQFKTLSLDGPQAFEQLKEFLS